jgi:hypothetical protein
MCDYNRNCIVVCLEDEDEMEEEDEGQTPPEKSGFIGPPKPFIGPPKPMVTAKNKPSKSAKQIEGAEALLAKLIKKGKKNCSIVHMDADLGKKTMLARFDTEIAKLTNGSRLYILGECIHPGGTLSGMVPGHLAERLVQNYGLKGAKKIVLVACEAGGLPNDFSNWTFAKAFHHILKTPFGITTVVAAFNRTVFIVTEEYAKLLTEHFKEEDRQVGSKFVEGYPPSMVLGVRTKSNHGSEPVPAKFDDDCKILWFWDGNSQKCGYWNYEKKILVPK